MYSPKINEIRIIPAGQYMWSKTKDQEFPVSFNLLIDEIIKITKIDTKTLLVHGLQQSIMIPDSNVNEWFFKSKSKQELMISYSKTKPYDYTK